MLVGDLQLPTAVDRIGLEVVEGLDLRIPSAVAQVLCSNVPKGVTLNHRMDAVGFFLLLLGGIDTANPYLPLCRTGRDHNPGTHPASFLHQPL